MVSSKRTIMITESQMLSLLFESVAVSDIYKKYYLNMPEKTFYNIIQSDPTYNTNKPDKMGKYGKWMLELYKKGNLKEEDLYKAKEDLEIFAKFQSKLQQKDIMRYHSLSELYNAIKPFLENPEQAATKSEEVRQLKKGAEKVYEDNKWIVIVPHTKESSCYYGKGTRWCTAANDSYNAFEGYNSEGLLYINIIKGTNTKYQFHFESSSYMDATDTPIDHPVADTIGLTTELTNFYLQKYGKKAAIDLTTTMYSDDLSEVMVEKLPDYYIADNNGQILKYNEQTKSFQVIYQLTDGYYYLTTESIDKRFIVIRKEDSIVDLFDIMTNKTLFNNPNITWIEPISRYDNKNCNYLNIHYNNNRQSVFSINTMKYTRRQISERYEMSAPLNLGKDMENYKNDLILITDSTKNKTALFSCSEGKPLSDFYNASWKEYIYYTFKDKNNQQPTMLAFYTLGDKYKDLYSAYIIMYDGQLYPYSQFAQYSDQILDKYFSQMTSHH